MTAMPHTAPTHPVRLMICDDSATIRSAIANILSADPDIEIVAKIADGRAALDMLRLHATIDMVLLDIEMPVMDGLTALPLLLAARPELSVIMVSAHSARGAEVSMQALRLGAADYVHKPMTAPACDQNFSAELLAKVHGVARLQRAHLASAAMAPLLLRPASPLKPKLLAIGSSTGGPNALFALVPQLRADLPIPVVLTQHMPAAFTPILAEHITRLGGMPCTEAKDGDTLLPGHILLAPGNRHMLIHQQGGTLVAKLTDTPPENFCRPSVDTMLRSACEAVDGRVLVAMLTGMGQDGLAGTRRIIEAGGTLIAQDEASSVVWGMPGAVAKAGLAHAVLPLSRMGATLQGLIDGTSGA